MILSNRSNYGNHIQGSAGGSTGFAAKPQSKTSSHTGFSAHLYSHGVPDYAQHSVFQVPCEHCSQQGDIVTWRTTACVVGYVGQDYQTGRIVGLLQRIVNIWHAWQQSLTCGVDLPADFFRSDRRQPRVGLEEALQITPCLRRDYVAEGVYEPEACDMDVNSLHQGYLRSLRAQGGRVLCNAKVSSLVRNANVWKIVSSAGDFYAPTILNTAGAWVDQIAIMAGAKSIGIQPLKRSACIAELPDGVNAEHWPLIYDIGNRFYFKPDAGCLLISPADETLSNPCDAWPEDIDIAIAIDRNPVVGYDPCVSGLFWIAALGGYGIQTAPAVGCLAAALLQHLAVPADILELGLNMAIISPDRFKQN